MKKLFLIFVLIFYNNISFASSEKIYLKCEIKVTNNQSNGLFAKIIKEGAFVQMSLSEINLKKKSSTITVYMPFPDFDKYKDSFNKKIKDPVIPKQKTNAKDGALTVEEAYSGVEDGSKVKIIDRFTFKNNDNKWSVKYRHLLRDEKAGVDINYIAEGQCDSIEKQLYKNIIKKGPTQKDYNF